MNACPQCGSENAASASICEHCQAPLDADGVSSPRLLAGIQGLIPAEPIISTGRLREDEPEGGAEVASTGMSMTEAAERADSISQPEEEQPQRGRHPVWIPAFEAEPA